jgi:hypothetical protein
LFWYVIWHFDGGAFARELGDNNHSIGINPTEPDVPKDLRAIAFDEGWQILGDIRKSPALSEDLVEQVEGEVQDTDLLVPNKVSRHYARRFGHFNWRHFLGQLRVDCDIRPTSK